ncbi:hypothetical protein D1872_350700 [compost metagenome]
MYRTDHVIKWICSERRTIQFEMLREIVRLQTEQHINSSCIFALQLQNLFNIATEL